MPPPKNMGAVPLCNNRFVRARTVWFSKKMVPPSTDMPRVLCLKGFWAFCVRTDVSHCFHSASTEADLTTGVANLAARTAVSPKNGERFTENSERFSENGERFILATAVSYSGTANTATATAIPCAGTAISRTYIICERVVKRSWNVLNAPSPPQSLYLLGFRQIRERWNLFFENQFSLLAQWMASRENKL